MNERRTAVAAGGRPKVLLIVHSYHHGNTRKVAEAMAGELGADIRAPDQVASADLAAYDLVGFGAGIDSGRHYKPLLDLADRLPTGPGRRVFLFSTCGIPEALAPEEMLERQIRANHAELRKRLEGKGYRILAEFGCVGFNTNSFLRFFGGLNKGRPNAGDLARAKEFAVKLRSSMAD